MTETSCNEGYQTYKFIWLVYSKALAAKRPEVDSVVMARDACYLITWQQTAVWCPIFTPCCLVGKRKMNTVHIAFLHLGIGHQAETGHHQSSSSSFSPSLSLSSPSSLSPWSSLSPCSSPSSSSSSSSPPSSSSSSSLSVSPQFPLFNIYCPSSSSIFHLSPGTHYPDHCRAECRDKWSLYSKLRFNLLAHPDHHPHGALLYIDIIRYIHTAAALDSTRRPHTFGAEKGWTLPNIYRYLQCQRTLCIQANDGEGCGAKISDPTLLVEILLGPGTGWCVWLCLVQILLSLDLSWCGWRISTSSQHQCIRVKSYLRIVHWIAWLDLIHLRVIWPEKLPKCGGSLGCTHDNIV